MSEALEMTSFKLIKGLTLEGFVAANEDIDLWLQRQPGFKWRRIGMGSDGYVVDTLLWTSANDAHRSTSGLLTEMAGSPVHATIDQATVHWLVLECLHTLMPPQ